MADPVVSGGVRLQVVYPYSSGLPEDVSTTSLAFVRPPGDTLEAFGDDVSVLWRTDFLDFPVSGQPLGSYFSNKFDLSVRYKFYDLSLPAPRFPYEVAGSLPAALAGEALPTEVALVCSLVAGQSTPRQRGRIYVGPFQQNLNEDGRPLTQFVTGLAAAMDNFRLAVQGSLSGRELCVLSQVDEELNIVTGGWVDNSFDTQRRRGQASTSRTRFGTYVG